MTLVMMACNFHIIFLLWNLLSTWENKKKEKEKEKES